MDRNYGMYTDDGNEEVHDIVRGNFDGWDALEALEILATESDYAEANDTAVKEAVFTAVNAWMVRRAHNVAVKAHSYAGR